MELGTLLAGLNIVIWEFASVLFFIAALLDAYDGKMSWLLALPWVAVIVLIPWWVLRGRHRNRRIRTGRFTRSQRNQL